MFPFKYKNFNGIVLNAYFNANIVKIDLGAIKTNYIVIIFYPLDFTFVCPTEIKRFSELKNKFDQLDTTVLFCSNDSVYSHKAWCTRSEKDDGIGAQAWPMLSDKRNVLSGALGLYDSEEGHVFRSTVIYDNKEKKIKHLSVNDDSIGRSTSEVLRIIEACRFNAEYGKICPVDFLAKKEAEKE
ncbi:hypothetical protein NUSPORA_01340 [Nucleospora cyclopteri]